MSIIQIDVRRSLTRTVAMVQARGPKGADGSDGRASHILYGQGVPTDGSGLPEDTYIDTDSGDFYRKEGESWVYRANMLGPSGWSPEFAIVPNGNLRVFKLIDWLGGGSGPKPDIQSGGLDQYVSATGFTTDINQATDITGPFGWSPVFAVVTDGARSVHQVADWIGGTGSKPATGAYVGASGFVASIADAVNIRGAAGAGASGDNVSINPQGGIQSSNAQAAIYELDTEKMAKADLIGIGFPYAGNGDFAPTGFLLADGRNVSRTTYSALFAKIGVTWGSGDGSTTFTIPDWRGRSLFGRDRGTSRNSAYLTDGVGAVGGSQYTQAHTHGGSGTTGLQSANHTHTGTTDANGEHAHYIDGHGTTANDSTGGNQIVTADGGNLGSHTDNSTSSGGNHTHTFTTGAESANHNHAFTFTTSSISVATGTAGNIPPAAVVDWMIYAGA